MPPSLSCSRFAIELLDFALLQLVLGFSPALIISLSRPCGLFMLRCASILICPCCRLHHYCHRHHLIVIVVIVIVISFVFVIVVVNVYVVMI